MAYTLISADGASSFELRAGGTLVLGRALASDIPVFDPTISRRHAEVTCDEAGVEVRDLGSSNGTFVNGTRVTTARIGPDDVVAFGKVSFRLVERAAAPARPASESARLTGPEGARGGPADSPTDVRHASPAAGPEGGTVVRQLRLADRPAPGIDADLEAGLDDVQAGGAGSGVAVTGIWRRGAAGRPDRSDEEKSEQKLALLLEVSKGLTRLADIDALLDKIARFCLRIFDVDYVSVLLADENGEQVPHVARDRHGAAPRRTVPQSIVRTVVQDKVAVLSDNAPADVRFGGESILVQRVRSTMCAPLVGGDGRVLGVLYVDNVTSTHRVDEEDLEFLVAFAGIAAVAIEHGQFSDRIRREVIVRNNFERYFAPSLARRIAAAPDAVRLGGDKRPIAVLFSDIRGFTALAESMTPDDIASLLSEYFTEMVECVFRHGGTLDKFMGDAVLAQWGAPLATGRDADCAVQAAIDMMRALDALNARWRAAGRPELGIGIGLSFGEAFAGNIGSERRLEYTVIGHTVNVASHLCSAAAPGEILLSGEMRDALHDPPPLEPRAALELTGNASAVSVYRVRCP